MDLQTVLNAMTHAGNKIFELFSFKILMAAVLTLFLHKHFILFMGFIILVFVDCITKWVAISYEFLKEKGVENPSILACIKGTKTARKAGRINSSTMKERGLGKIAIYVICAFVAGVGDLMMHILNTPTWMVSLVIGYMVVTEVLSVIENLSDAGVDVLDKLIGKLKGRL